MNGKNFTLEFSPKTPRFYCNYNRFKKNTNGYVTIIENCSEEESIKFIEFVEIHKGKNKLTTNHVFELLEFYNKK